jgi:hypothetical protein
MSSLKLVQAGHVADDEHQEARRSAASAAFELGFRVTDLKIKVRLMLPGLAWGRKWGVAGRAEASTTAELDHVEFALDSLESPLDELADNCNAGVLTRLQERLRQSRQALAAKRPMKPLECGIMTLTAHLLPVGHWLQRWQALGAALCKYALELEEYHFGPRGEAPSAEGLVACAQHVDADIRDRLPVLERLAQCADRWPLLHCLAGNERPVDGLDDRMLALHSWIHVYSVFSMLQPSMVNVNKERWPPPLVYPPRGHDKDARDQFFYDGRRQGKAYKDLRAAAKQKYPNWDIPSDSGIRKLVVNYARRKGYPVPEGVRGKRRGSR